MAAALCFSVNYIRSIRKFRESVPADDTLAKHLASDMHIHRKITVRESDYIRSPLTYKLFRPVILIPKNMSDMLNEEQMTYIYTHELVHIRRFDAVIKFLCTAAVCIHWFNPLVWIMYLLLDRDMELACDETAIHILGSSSRSDYAMTLVRFAEFRASSAVFSSFSKNALTERVTAVMKKSSSSPFAVTSAFVLFLAITLAFGTSAALSKGADREAGAAPEAVSEGNSFSDTAQNLFNLDWMKTLNRELSADGAAEGNEMQKKQDNGKAKQDGAAANTPNGVQNSGTQGGASGHSKPTDVSQSGNGVSVLPVSPGNLNTYSPSSGALETEGNESGSGSVSVGTVSPSSLKIYD